MNVINLAHNQSKRGLLVCKVLVILFLLFPSLPALSATDSDGSVDRVGAIIKERALLEQLVGEMKKLQRLVDQAECQKSSAVPKMNYRLLRLKLGNLEDNVEAWLGEKPPVYRQLETMRSSDDG